MVKRCVHGRLAPLQLSRPPRTSAVAPFRSGPKARGKPRERTVAMRPYELMYLMPPTADEERLGAISERLQSAITSLGGKIDKATPPGRRRLAYEVEHHRD